MFKLSLCTVVSVFALVFVFVFVFVKLVGELAAIRKKTMGPVSGSAVFVFCIFVG